MTDPSEMTREALEDEVLYLREELGMRNEQPARMSSALKLTPQEAFVLSILYSAKGRVVRDGFINDVLPTWYTKDRDMNAVKVHVSRIRKRHDHDVIETVLGFGYRITPKGMALCAQALAA